MTQQVAAYGASTKLQVPYEQAVQRVTAALKEEGFGVLTEIDVRATWKQKLGADFRKYVILGACNPPLAHQALQVDLDVGLLLPCNVIVYEEGPDSIAAIVDPVAMLSVIRNPARAPVAEEAKARLTRVLHRLADESPAGWLLHSGQATVRSRRRRGTSCVCMR